MEKNLIYLIVVVILILLILVWTFRNEKFISFMADLSEYGPQPLLILTKYIPDINSQLKMNYPELDNYTNTLVVLEIFSNQTYKVYSDDGLVREGIVPEYLWIHVKYLYDIAQWYHNKSFCNFVGQGLTKYYLWVGGYNIDLGIFAEGCVPDDLYRTKSLFNLMEFSDISA